MSVNVSAPIRELTTLQVAELKQRYAEAFGEQTRSNNRDFLEKRIAWRIQANAGGDLSERARHRAEELANDADLRWRAPSTPTPTAAPKGAEGAGRPDQAAAWHGRTDARLADRQDVPRQQDRGPRAGKGVRVRGDGLPLALGGGRGRHRGALERLPVLQRAEAEAGAEEGSTREAR